MVGVGLNVCGRARVEWPPTGGGGGEGGEYSLIAMVTHQTNLLAGKFKNTFIFSYVFFKYFQSGVNLRDEKPTIRLYVFD